MSTHIETKPTPLISPEEIMRETICAFTGLNFIKPTYQYCQYDGRSKYYLLELKHRYDDYEDWYIEFKKFAYNITFAEYENLGFLYASEYKNKIYMYNIRELRRDGFEFDWNWKQLPETTEFGTTKLVWKKVGLLPKERAYLTITTDG